METSLKKAVIMKDWHI